ncbi:MAG: RNA polymerase sigma factor [Leptonema sp. (in: bacteria)]
MEKNKESKNLEFKRLYELHSKDILLFLYRLTKNLDLAKDFLQDTFINFIKIFSGRELPDPLKCKIYLFQTAKNIFINHYRKEKKLTLLKNDFTIEEKSTNSNLTHENDEKEKVFWELVESLNYEDRTLIILRYNLDMKLEEISEIIKKSKSTISRRLEKVKKKLIKIAKEKELL